MVLENRRNPGRHGNLGDREYFTTHRDHANAGLYISRPMTSRVTATR